MCTVLPFNIKRNVHSAALWPTMANVHSAAPWPTTANVHSAALWPTMANVHSAAPWPTMANVHSAALQTLVCELDSCQCVAPSYFAVQTQHVLVHHPPLLAEGAKLSSWCHGHVIDIGPNRHGKPRSGILYLCILYLCKSGRL